jgi:hypothetical protein
VLGRVLTEGHERLLAEERDALARLQLAAHAHGSRVVLRNASAELLDLVELVGLTEVLAVRD